MRIGNMDYARSREVAIMETQDSPAKQFLAAVSKASQELELAIAQTYEEAMKLNVQLTDSAKVQIEQTDASLEEELRLSVVGVQEERQKILGELALLRKEETQALADTGAKFREYLTSKVSEQIEAFDGQLKEYIANYQQRLEAVEQKVAEEAASQTSVLTENQSTFQASLDEQVQNSKKMLDELQIEQQKKLITVAEQAVTALTELTAKLEAQMRQDAQDVAAKMQEDLSAQSKQNSPVERTANLKKLAVDEEKVASMIADQMEEMKALPSSLEEACLEVAKIQQELHGSSLLNAVGRCKNELQSAAKHTESQLNLIGAETKLALSELERLYSEKFQYKMEEFERIAQKEVLEGLAEQERAGMKVSASKDKELKDLFLTLRKSTAESVRTTVRETEKNFESIFDDYKAQLERQKEEKSGELEKECRRASDQLSLVFKKFDDDSTSIEQQIAELESAASELDEFVSALSHADLDF